MNRSYSKIRHIQEVNQRLETRLINEQIFDEKEFELNSNFALATGYNSKYVSRLLNKLPETLSYLALKDCDFADFSEIDLCNGFPDLKIVHLKGTENNLMELFGDCFEEVSPDMYEKI
jgi:hypothetical protein